MTRTEIEKYLQEPRESMQMDVYQEIENLRKTALEEKNEASANLYSCLGLVFFIQKDFIAIYQNLKRKNYLGAWESLVQTEVQLEVLEQNFDIGSLSDDKYNLIFIKNTLPEYRKLFPYEFFLNREAVLKEEKCSICGEKIRLRGGCGHRSGKVYMGEICIYEATDMNYLEMVYTRDPFDPFSLSKPYQEQCSYEMLDVLADSLNTPYDFWYVEVVSEENPLYKNAQRNDPCPCGSGKKYKHCCINDPKKRYFDHYKLRLMNEISDHPDRPLKMVH